MIPNRNYLLIIPDKKNAEKITASGIVYETEKSSSAAVKEATLRGIVQKLGEGVNNDMKNGNRISAGDVVHFFPDNVTEIEYEGKPIVLVHRKYVSHIE